MNHDSQGAASLDEREIEEIEESARRATRRSSIPPSSVEAAVGAAAGAVAGVMLGPIGVIAGAALGGVIGAAAGEALDTDEHERQRHNEELDRDIGVIGGDIGEASPDQPKPKLGLFSRASIGGGTHTPETSDGPMQNVDD